MNKHQHNEGATSMESREKLIAKDLLSIRAVFFRPDEPPHPHRA